MPDVLTDADIANRIRAGQRCQLCKEDHRPGGRLCWDHHDELARVLDPDYIGERDLERAASIPHLYARLDPTPATTGLADRRAPGFASTPPCSLDPIVMRDYRSASFPVVEVWYDPHPSGRGDDESSPHTEDPSPPRAVDKAIFGLVETVWAGIDHPPRASLARIADLLTFAGDQYGIREVSAWCRWLHRHVDTIASREDAAEIYRDLLELHDQLRPAAGDPKPRPVAHCTGWVRDRETREKVECKAPLYMPPPQPGVPAGRAKPPTLDPSKPVMRCDRCDRPYSYLQLLRAEIGEQRQAC